MIVAEIHETKAIKDKTEYIKSKLAVLKIVANAGFFGKFGAEGWLKDMRALVTVTFNGQLQLLMLVETLESINFPVVNANTDGIITKVENKRFDEYYDVCNDWEKKTKIKLKYAVYLKYFKRDVNHYLALTDDGIIKSKGAEFNPEIDILKGYKYPVVSVAVEKFFMDKIPIKDTILKHDDILDFCISQKVGRQFIIEEHRIIDGKLDITKLQHNIRYYVSSGGSVLMKRYVEFPTHKIAHPYNTPTLFDYYGEDDALHPQTQENPTERLVKDAYCTVINNLFYVADFKDYDINYNFYLGEADKIVQSVYGQLNLDKASSKMKTGRMLD